MIAKVQKWGNSLAVRIPKAYAVGVKLDIDSMVEIGMVEGNLVITPVPAPELTLDALLAGVTQENLLSGVDTGEAVGNDLW